MPPTFLGLIPNRGVEEDISKGVAGVIVPMGGSNVVLLADGPGLDVAPSSPAVKVEKIVDPSKLPVWTPLLPVVLAIHKLKAGAFRAFNIACHSSCKDALVLATSGKSKIEAKLMVSALKPKTVKISIRPTQVLDDHGHRVNLNLAPFDPKSLLDDMNLIWQPQANIVFKLGRTDPAFIEGLTPEGRPYPEKGEKDKASWFDSFVKNKDSAASFTMFMVRRVFDGSAPVAGANIANEGMAWISDDRFDNTMAHEAGHLLGAGDAGTDQDLMADGSPGNRIPYELAKKLNS